MFTTLHTHFETQYTKFAVAVDGIGEHTRALGAPAPGSFTQFMEQTAVKEDTGIGDADALTIHTLRKSCGVNWANHLPTHVTQAYMGHADITTTQQYYLSVTEEHAERTSWMIEQVTMLGEDKTDARVTPEAKIDDSRQVG